MWPLNPNGTPMMIEIDRVPRLTCLGPDPFNTFDPFEEPRKINYLSFVEDEREKEKRDRKRKDDEEWQSFKLEAEQFAHYLEPMPWERKSKLRGIPLPELEMPDVDLLFIETPTVSFESGWDRIHRHSYPQSHDDIEFGATYWQRDLDTGKRKNLGRFEVDIDL